MDGYLFSKFNLVYAAIHPSLGRIFNQISLLVVFHEKGELIEFVLMF